MRVKSACKPVFVTGVVGKEGRAPLAKSFRAIYLIHMKNIWVPIWVCIVALGATNTNAKTIRLELDKTWVRGTSYTYAPGDTFCLASGKRPFQYFKGFHGSATKPLVFNNCSDGQAIVGKGTNYGMVLDSVTYVHLTGTGASGVQYGIWLDSTAAGSGLGVANLSHHVEIDHLRISHSNFAGIMAKKDYSGSPPNPAPVFDGLHIHHNWIHDTGGEGMYLGETKSPGMLFKNMNVHDNLIQRTGWDLLQIANAVENIRVHHNVMMDGGVAKELYQANGIQIGDQSRDVRIDHNIVNRADENSIICFGSGSVRIDSNWFSGSGGTQATFNDHRTFVDTGSTIRYDHNWWSDAAGTDIFRINNDLVLLTIDSNRIESSPNLVKFNSGAGLTNTTLKDNTITTIAPITFADSAGGDYRIPANSPYAKWNLGFGTVGASHTLQQFVSHIGNRRGQLYDLLGREK